MILQRLIAAGILTGAVGCARVREVFEPTQFINEKRPQVVYVIQRSRATVTIVDPHVSGDTVIGKAFSDGSPLAVPFSDVHSVSAVRVDGVRTVLLAAGLSGATALMLYAFLGSSSGGPTVFCDMMTEMRWGCPDR
jgi:hypothetical protein